jgi:hypothetical protein
VVGVLTVDGCDNSFVTLDRTMLLQMCPGRLAVRGFAGCRCSAPCTVRARELGQLSITVFIRHPCCSVCGWLELKPVLGMLSDCCCKAAAADWH